MKRVLLITLLLLIAGIGVFFYNDYQKAQQYASYQMGERYSLTLGAEAGILTAAIWVAQEEGIFDQYGLDVDISSYTSGKASLEALAQEEVMLATAATTPIVLTSFERDDIVIIGTFVTSDDNIKLTVRSDADIQSIKDLAGKRVGTTAGTTAQFVTSAVLTYAGLLEQQVAVSSYAPDALPEALATNALDAMIIWEPHGTTANTLLDGQTQQLDISDTYHMAFNLLSHRTVAQQNQEALERFMSAMIDATAIVNRRPAKAQAIVAQATGISLEDIQNNWHDYSFDVSMRQSLLLALEDEAQWAIDTGLTDATDVPNYIDYLVTDVLQAVAPRLVTVIGK